MGNYRYNLFGLSISSEIEIPQLLEEPWNVDDKNLILIKYGKIPEEIKNKNQVYHFEDRNNVYVFINKIANYSVHDGNLIIVEKNVESQENRVIAFLLSWVFGVLFIQRNLMIIHGSCVSNDKGAIVFAGESGMGKSTIAEVMKLKGYKYMSDDLSAIKIDKEEVYIKPSYPQGKLSKNTMIELGYDENNFKIVKKDDERERYYIPQNECFKAEKSKLVAICEIVIGDKEYVEIEEIRGTEVLSILLENLYSFWIEKYLGIRKEYFSQCLAVAKNIKVFRIKRPKDKFSVYEQIEKIEEFIG